MESKFFELAVWVILAVGTSLFLIWPFLKDSNK